MHSSLFLLLSLVVLLALHASAVPLAAFMAPTTRALSSLGNLNTQAVGVAYGNHTARVDNSRLALLGPAAGPQAWVVTALTDLAFGTEPFALRGGGTGQAALLRDLYEGPGSSMPYAFTSVAGNVYFLTTTSTLGAQLYVATLTSDGTTPLCSAVPVALGGVPAVITAMTASRDGSALYLSLRSDSQYALAYLLPAVNGATAVTYVLPDLCRYVGAPANSQACGASTRPLPAWQPVGDSGAALLLAPATPTTPAAAAANAPAVLLVLPSAGGALRVLNASQVPAECRFGPLTRFDAPASALGALLYVGSPQGRPVLCSTDGSLGATRAVLALQFNSSVANASLPFATGSAQQPGSLVLQPPSLTYNVTVNDQVNNETYVRVEYTPQDWAELPLHSVAELLAVYSLPSAGQAEVGPGAAAFMAVVRLSDVYVGLNYSCVAGLQDAVRLELWRVVLPTSSTEAATVTRLVDPLPAGLYPCAVAPAPVPSTYADELLFALQLRTDATRGNTTTTLYTSAGTAAATSAYTDFATMQSHGCYGAAQGTFLCNAGGLFYSLAPASGGMRTALSDVSVALLSGAMLALLPEAASPRVWFAANNVALNAHSVYSLAVLSSAAPASALPAVPTLELSVTPRGDLGSEPGAALVLSQTLAVFAATNATVGRELWATSGRAPARLLADINAGAASSEPAFLMAFAGLGSPTGFVFQANNGVAGAELFYCDGVAAPVLLRDVLPGPEGSAPAFMTPLGGSSFVFAADAANLTRTVYAYNGATDTLTPLFASPTDTAVSPSQADSFVRGAAGTASALVYFRAWTSTAGAELWVTDGTLAGTRMVADLAPGPASSMARPAFYSAAQQRLYLAANPTPFNPVAFVTLPYVLAAGAGAQPTVLASPAAPATDPVMLQADALFGQPDVFAPVEFAGVVVVAACRAAGCQLYASDGSSLSAFCTGGAAAAATLTSNAPHDLTVAGPLLFWVANDAIYSAEQRAQCAARVSSASVSNVRLLAAVPQPAGSQPRSLVLFAGSADSVGTELRAITETETGLVNDFFTGYQSSAPQVLGQFVVGQSSRLVLLSARSYTGGAEPYALFGTPLQNAPVTVVPKPDTTLITAPVIDRNGTAGESGSSFLLKILAVREVDPVSGLEVASFDPAAGTGGVESSFSTPDLQAFAFSDVRLGNGALYSSVLYRVSRGLAFPFAGQELLLADNAIKLSLSVAAWPFQSPLNRLELLIGLAGVDASFCGARNANQRAAQQQAAIDAGQPLQILTTDGLQLTTRFFPVVLLDGSPVTMTQRAVATPGQELALVLSVPAFASNVTIDPDVSIGTLFDASGDGNGVVTDCGRSGGQDGFSRNQIIIVSCTVGGAALCVLCVIGVGLLLLRSGRLRRFFVHESPEEKRYREDYDPGQYKSAGMQSFRRSTADASDVVGDQDAVSPRSGGESPVQSSPVWSPNASTASVNAPFNQ